MAQSLNDDDVLDRLNDAEQRQLFARLAARFNSTDKSDYSHEELATFSAVRAALGEPDSLSGARAHLSRYVRNAGGRNRFREKVDDLDGFLTRACGTTLSRTQRDSLRALAIGSLAEMVSGWTNQETGLPIPLNVPVLINNLDRVGEAVDMNFPGYARAKLLHRVLI